MNANLEMYRDICLNYVYFNDNTLSIHNKYKFQNIRSLYNFAVEKELQFWLLLFVKEEIID